MSGTSKVLEIFREAGQAFEKLGLLTSGLEQASDAPPSSGKWKDEEIEMLYDAIKRFGSELTRIDASVQERITQTPTPTH